MNRADQLDDLMTANVLPAFLRTGMINCRSLDHGKGPEYIPGQRDSAGGYLSWCRASAEQDHADQIRIVGHRHVSDPG